jgi:hypothetical protein
MAPSSCTACALGAAAVLKGIKQLSYHKIPLERAGFLTLLGGAINPFTYMDVARESLPVRYTLYAYWFRLLLFCFSYLSV